MAKRKAHLVFYLDHHGSIFLDSVHGQYWKAVYRKEELESYKWVRKSWLSSPDMNETDLEICITKHLSEV